MINNLGWLGLMRGLLHHVDYLGLLELGWLGLALSCLRILNNGLLGSNLAPNSYLMHLLTLLVHWLA